MAAKKKSRRYTPKKPKPPKADAVGSNQGLLWAALSTYRAPQTSNTDPRDRFGAGKLNTRTKWLQIPNSRICPLEHMRNPNSQRLQKTNRRMDRPTRELRMQTIRQLRMIQ